ncbi:F0F1 ATP synthase subunit delta [Pseudaestuariivita sp.]|uniref:F0F1 ATP synthase subunit delta n=1 Tax=Pseudaestuariivita sp. TaxID=2211669 RepID=UPI0040596697
MDVSEPASISSGIAERYATAVFEIARDNDNLGKLESSVDDLGAALDTSEELRDMIGSPVLTREAQGQAITAVAKAVGVSPVMQNVLGLMAEKRRLFVLPHMLAHLDAMIAAHKGEVTAEVTSAQALSAAQSKKLAETLKARFGQDVNIKATVDESLIGGLVVKVGSKMIDTSVRAKLNALQNAMKEVG